MQHKEIKRILVSQPEPTNQRSPYFRLAEEYGVEFVFRPLFSIQPIGLRPLRDQKVDPLGYTGVILTSRTITDHFFTQLKEQRIELPATMRYYCASEVIAGYLQKYIQVRKRRVYVPETNGSHDELMELILKKKKELYLLPSVENQTENISPFLEEKGYSVTKYLVSRMVYDTFDEAYIKGFDMVVFFSPNGVHSLYSNIPGFTPGEGQVFGCLGEGAKAALVEAGLEVEVFAPRPGVPSLTAALELYLKEECSEE